jgi:signal peptide peptidase SppA
VKEHYLQLVQSAVFGTPWLITENGMQLVTGILISHLEGNKLSAAETQAAADSRSYGSGYDDPPEQRVGIINLHGTIMNRASSMNLSSSDADPQRFAAKLKALADNREISRIVISIDSPGGTVQGTREAADAVAYAASKKEVIAVADGMMASAAYWIGSQATRVIATPDAMVGSISVLMALKDTSAKEEKDGIKTVVLRTGEFKALGQQGEPIDQKVIDERMELLNTYHGQFIDAIVAGRKMPKEKATSLANGKVYVGASAVRAGLADDVGTLQDAISGKFSMSSSSGASRPAAAHTRPLAKGQNMDQILALLGLAADATDEQIKAGLEAHTAKLVADQRAKFLATLGLKPEATEADLNTLKAQAADGAQYRTDLLAKVSELVIAVEGNNEAGQAAAQRKTRLLATASIQDLTAEVADLQAKKDGIFPGGRLSQDPAEKPAAQPTRRKPVIYK